MPREGICYIIGAGTLSAPLPAARSGDFVIAADAGYRAALRDGVRVDLVIGDFDSLGQPPQHEHVLALPIQKDDTDMLAAIHVGMERGHSVFHIYGGTGGRLDHTLANLQCIAALAAHGAHAFLYDDNTIITAVKDGRLSFPAGGAGTVSVFSHSDVSEGVYETGFQYALNNATLSNRYPIGISNAFTGTACAVSVNRGTLIVMYASTVEGKHEPLKKCEQA